MPASATVVISREVAGERGIKKAPMSGTPSLSAMLVQMIEDWLSSPWLGNLMHPLDVFERLAGQFHRLTIFWTNRSFRGSG